MQKQILFVGLDVDDKAFHGGIFNISTGEVTEFRVAPSATSVHKILRAYLEKYEVRVCYEAGYLGFSLYRDLVKFGYHCDVIAPSLIPTEASNRVKTDRLDALKLTRYYASNLLTLVHVPSEIEESHRLLLRSRKFLVYEATRFRNRITGTCRTLGWNFRKETNKVHYWTLEHLRWLKLKIKNCDNECTKLNMSYLLSQLDSLLGCIDSYDLKIKALSEEEMYKEKVQALKCYRSIETNTAMVLTLEIGDVKRFKHPSQLTAYAGLNVSEYSSGGKEKKFQITKQGNKYLRSALIESCQTALNPPVVSRYLTKRRQQSKPEYWDVADRCMQRLYKKGTRLIYAGKHRNKAKVACARELLGFIWESLNKVAN